MYTVIAKDFQLNQNLRNRYKSIIILLIYSKLYKNVCSNVRIIFQLFTYVIHSLQFSVKINTSIFIRYNSPRVTFFFWQTSCKEPLLRLTVNRS